MTARRALLLAAVSLAALGLAALSALARLLCVAGAEEEYGE